MRTIIGKMLLRTIAATLGLLSVSGCGFLAEQESVEGVWASTGIDRVFLEITKHRFTTYDFAGDELENGPDCYRTAVASITTVEGDAYTLSSPTNPSLRYVVTLEIVEGRLTVATDGAVETFVRSERTVASFVPECTAR